MFYPRGRLTSAARRRCSLDVDPVQLVRGRRGSASPLDQYVNDRPYVAQLAAECGHRAGAGHGAGRPLQGKARAGGTAASARGPDERAAAAAAARSSLRRLFEPLGYAVEATPHTARRAVCRMGREPVLRPRRCTATARLADLLSHLYVLIPVLDDSKHYWIGDDEVEKLLRHGESWLAAHPEREAIASPLPAHQRGACPRGPRPAADRRDEPAADEEDAEDKTAAEEPRRAAAAPERAAACRR